MFQPCLGVSYNIISDRIEPRTLQAIARSGIATLEMPSALFDPASPAFRPATVRKTLSEAGNTRVASVHARFGPPYDLSSPDRQVQIQSRDEVLSSIDLAVELGASIVVVHASAEPIDPRERADRLSQAADILADIGSRAGEADVRIGVELLPRTCLGNTTHELLQLLSLIENPAFGVCLDVNHLMDRYQEIPAAVRHLGERLITLHLSDYDGVDEKHWMPGQGVIDWAAFVEALRDIGYTGPFNYESTPSGDTPEERIEECEKNFAWLSSL